MAVSKLGKPSHQTSSWWKQTADIAGFIWRAPKTPIGWLKYAGTVISDYTITREKQRWETLSYDFDGMDCYYLAKGAGQLIASWILNQREVSFGGHLARLEAIVLALDEIGHLPLEKAITRFIASKVALSIEGYTSQLQEQEARYQRYQKQAKVLLSILPMKNYQGLSQKTIFLGIPFSSESVFMVCHRFLDAASVEKNTDDLQAYLKQWQEKTATRPEDFYAKLLAQSYRQDDPAILNAVFEDWFNAYRQFILSRVESREKWLNRGFRLLGTQIRSINSSQN